MSSLSQFGNAHEISRSNVDKVSRRVVAADHHGAKVSQRFGAGQDDLMAGELLGLRQELACAKGQIELAAASLQDDDRATILVVFVFRGVRNAVVAHPQNVA